MHSPPLLSPFTLTFQVGHQKLGVGSCCLIPCAGQSSVNLAYSSGQNSLDKYILGMQSIVFISHGIDQLTICFLSENSFSKDIAKQNACMAIQLKLNLVHAFLTSSAAKSLQSCLTLCDPIDGSPPGSSSLGFSRQEHWSGLPFPSPSNIYFCKKNYLQNFTDVVGKKVFHSASSLFNIELLDFCFTRWATQVAQWERICLSMLVTQVRSLGLEDPLEKEMATHSSILAWRIPWTKAPGGLQLMGS